MEAGTLNCPMCGAATASDATQCAHCGARLATVACPSCFGLMFSGEKFCPQCGARAEQKFSPLNPPKACPRCQTEMGSLTVGKTTVCECPKCEGLWVDVASFEQICVEREGETPAAPLGPASFAPVNEVRLENVRYVKCPECGVLMNRVNFAHCSGVIIDVCRGHGSWFDRDELRRIIEFIRRGGLMISRAREVEELKAEKLRLSQNEAAGGFAPVGSPGAFNDGRCRTSLAIQAAAELLDFLVR